jgi:hypothetical protein
MPDAEVFGLGGFGQKPGETAQWFARDRSELLGKWTKL